MNKQETIQVITLLAGNYDSIAKKDKTQKEIMVNIWFECLGDLDYKLVLQSVKKTIIESPYPPTIHDIRKNAIEIANPSNNRNALDAWNEAYLMISNGLYMTQEEFEQHSPEVRNFFGSVRQVYELAQADADVVNTVTKGQFLKQYEIIENRKREQKLLPVKMKKLIEQMTNNMSIKQLGE